MSRYRYGKKRPRTLTSTELVQKLVRQNKVEDSLSEDQDFEEEMQDIKDKAETLEQSIRELDDLTDVISDQYWCLSVAIEKLEQLM